MVYLGNMVAKSKVKLNTEPSLLKINQDWAVRNTCGLKKTATQAVFGKGNPRAEIVFIGEAPGKKEDLEGVPFVGSSGKFLDEMLSSIKMKREDIYITNIVKYRPPNNRDPLPKEIESCSEWLHDELEYISPKIVVFLGRHSMNHFFPEAKISETHGELLFGQPIVKFLNKNILFFSMYHPAAALYNGSMREILIADFKKIPIILKGI